MTNKCNTAAWFTLTMYTLQSVEHPYLISHSSNHIFVTSMTIKHEIHCLYF